MEIRFPRPTARPDTDFDSHCPRNRILGRPRPGSPANPRPDTTKAWDLSTHFRTAMPDVVTLPQLFKNHGCFSQGMGKICHHGYDDPPSWSVPTAYPKAPHGAGKRVQNPNGPKVALSPNPFPQKDAPKYAVPPGGELRSYSGVPKGWPIQEDFARTLKHDYYATISYVDAQVGRLLDELDRQGLRENTIIILWGDHGWKLGEHQAWAKHSNVEDDTRAPLILSVPGMARAGGTTNALVEFVDIYPTLAELAGLPLPAHLEGTSFKPLLDQPDRPWKSAAFSQFPRGKALMGCTMRTDRCRYTKWVDRKDPTKVDAVELYDHQTDPQENSNIAKLPGKRKIVAELDQKWQAGWKAGVPD